MKFKESPYYNEEFLGIKIYESIGDYDEILTIKEFFNINYVEKEYLKDGTGVDGEYYNYKLVVCKDYYELDCQNFNDYLFLVFDKPVHITGKYCRRIIVPEVIIKSSENSSMFRCVANKLVINDIDDYYDITWSKINHIYFYNSFVTFWESKINNFFIFNKYLCFHDSSKFLNYHTVKFFGKCEDLEQKILSMEEFKQGIIHIE